MNVTRHVAKDMRTALGMVREIHGPDAVILSNRRIPEGIEITATAEYEEPPKQMEKSEPEKFTFPSIDTEDTRHIVSNSPRQDRTPRRLQEQGGQRLVATEPGNALGVGPKAARTLAAGLKERARRSLASGAAAKTNQTNVNTEPEADFEVELSQASKALPKAPETKEAAHMPGQDKQSPGTEDSFDDYSFDETLDTLLNQEMGIGELPEPLDQAIAENTNVEQGSVPLEVAETLSEQTPSRESQALWTNDSMIDEMRKELSSLRSLVETQISGFAWGEINRRNPVRAGILRQLVALGLSSTIARQLSDQIPEELGHRKAWFRALASLSARVPVVGDTILTNGGHVALVGPAGVGKTTMIAKLAVQYALRHGRENVALVTTDSSRFGAFDQIRNLAGILKMPVRAVGSGPELEAALDSFSDRQLILIDTAGLSHRDERLTRALQTLRTNSPNLKAHIVLSATTQVEALEQIITAFKPVDLCGCIISKVDESSSLGPVLSAIAEHKLPVSYYSDGQKIPDDLKIAQVEELVGKAVAISKSMDAFEKTEDVMIEQMLMGERL